MRIPRAWIDAAAATLAVVMVAGIIAGPGGPSARALSGDGCDPGSRPEKIQGRVPAADYKSGRAAKGYFCNARQIAHYGTSGGFRVERYVDKAGHECAFYDSTLLFPHNAHEHGAEGAGVFVLDMKNPKRPVQTDTLRTPAMLSPHESV